MRTWIGGLATLAVMAAICAVLDAQTVRILTYPEIPQRETLTRLGLKLNWSYHLPVDGKRDGIATIQILDGKYEEAIHVPPEGINEPGGAQIVVQTRSGRLTVIDAESGKEMWHAWLGPRYRAEIQPVAANMRTIFAIAEGKIYALDRLDGMVEWRYDLPGALSTAPVADSERMVLVSSATNRAHAYLLPPSPREIRRDQPKPEEDPSKPPAEIYPGRGESGRAALSLKLKPSPIFSGQVDAGVFQPPVILPGHAVLVDGEGTVMVFSRDRRVITDRYRTKAAVVAPMGRHGESVYVASKDFNVYGFDIAAGQLNLAWRVTTGNAITQPPIVLGKDVLIVAEERGIFCIDRETGKVRWPDEAQRKKHPPLKSVIGGSSRLIYAVDLQGRLVVFDRDQGSVVGTLDTRDYAILLPNDVTDRLYLANHDGLIVCLQDLDKASAKPIYHNFIPRPGGKPKEGDPKDPGMERNGP